MHGKVARRYEVHEKRDAFRPETGRDEKEQRMFTNRRTSPLKTLGDRSIKANE